MSQAMPAIATLALLASPFLVGAAVAHWRPANRLVARLYWPSLAVGWIGVGLLLAAVLVLHGAHRNAAGLAGAPLAGLSFWSRRDGGDDDDPDDDPAPGGEPDWEEFTRALGEYVVARDRSPAPVGP
jgi:hypothetical protein